MAQLEELPRAADNASQQNVTANDGLATERQKRWWEGETEH